MCHRHRLTTAFWRALGIPVGGASSRYGCSVYVSLRRSPPSRLSVAEWAGHHWCCGTRRRDQIPAPDTHLPCHNTQQLNDSLANQQQQQQQLTALLPVLQPYWLTDWLSCGFTSHSTQNRSFRRLSPSQSLGLVRKKTKPNTTKAHIHQWKETQNKHKKLKPGLVAICDIQPGNRVGLLSKEGDK